MDHLSLMCFLARQLGLPEDTPDDQLFARLDEVFRAGIGEPPDAALVWLVNELACVHAMLDEVERAAARRHAAQSRVPRWMKEDPWA